MNIIVSPEELLILIDSLERRMIRLKEKPEEIVLLLQYLRAQLPEEADAA